ncbi:hypothetical protein [Schlesneria paludicola]|uniref:hypothetical protein n=1 Tax=Schlesneria paludicola TaxID=360056 RepID=UPI00029A27DD|nr:hypothetical protein [Schlesneria paludicola]
MNLEPDDLINGHLDACLSVDEQRALNDWLKQSPDNARRFALATLLHNRIQVEYQSLNATLDQLDSVRIATAPRSRATRRVAIFASAACLCLAAFLYLLTAENTTPTATAVAAFHELTMLSRESADRTYRVSFVDEQSQRAERNNAGPNRPKPPDGPAKEAMLYVRGGRQFVYSWKAAAGDFINGSDGTSSWSIRPDRPLEVNGDQMHFTGVLPAVNYLSPVLSFFDGQEKRLVADYNLELFHPDATTNLLVAVKKPDTKQGPRRIEIRINPTSQQLSEMRIYPETPDHRVTNYTRIQLISQDPLDGDWFTPGFHQQRHPSPAAGAAD